jgi:L-seryl-tRNA(Ser) seleniumtransferase
MTEQRPRYDAASPGRRATARADLSTLPRIDALVAAAGALVETHGRDQATDALRRAVDAARSALAAGAELAVPDAGELVDRAAADLASRRPGPPRPVLNATGVVVHTNLGRAPLSAAARTAMDAAAGACDLELDLGTGGRGSRSARLEPLLIDATGAEAGIAVNNCAAALALALATLASGREVLVSRGELVEIGGSFRLPEIMGASGARLREVGTTNRTRADDYRAGARGPATGPETALESDPALILKVHPSNYRIEGFTEEPTVAELATVARERAIPLLHDVGSGLLNDAADPALAGEPSVRASLAAGADLVVCSGDKLLGGPQAGLLLGRADLVERCRRHPLHRAVRLDKLRIAALVATLEAHLRGTPERDVPVWSMLRADPATLRRRAEGLAAEVGGQVVEGAGVVGGGAAPGGRLPGPVVRVDHGRPDEVARRLRAGSPPVVARVDDGALWLDPRTIPADADATLSRAVRAALRDG